MTWKTPEHAEGVVDDRVRHADTAFHLKTAIGGKKIARMAGTIGGGGNSWHKSWKGKLLAWHNVVELERRCEGLQTESGPDCKLKRRDWPMGSLIVDSGVTKTLNTMCVEMLEAERDRQRNATFSLGKGPGDGVYL